MPVVTGTDHSYTISLGGRAIPANWIIEFSDSIFGNKWAPDQITLNVIGRTCNNPVTSQHDRQFIWGDSNDNFLNVPGRGACSSFPDKPRVDCSKVPSMYITENCPQCSSVNCGPNGYCDCGTSQCICESGFYGANCEYDICDLAKCDPKQGACNIRYLGGDIPATLGQCACKPGFFGSQCNANPCATLNCGKNGQCDAVSANNAVCVCNDGWDGPACDHFCGNSTTYPKCTPPCVLGIRYYANSGFTGNNLFAQQTDAKEDCGALCVSRSDCYGFAYNGFCYLKGNGGKIVSQNGDWGGTKCSSQIDTEMLTSEE